MTPVDRRRLGLALALAATLAMTLRPVVGEAHATPLAPDDRDAGAVAFAAALDGDWQGTLEYRDYRTDERTKLPTTLRARPEEDGRAAVLAFRYDEGKGRFVEGKSTLRLDSKKKVLTWESDGGKNKLEYAFTGLDDFLARRPGGLVLLGPGTENGASVEARQTITLDGDELTILRESRKPGEAYAFRNAYKLKRTPPPLPAARPPAP